MNRNYSPYCDWTGLHRKAQILAYFLRKMEQALLCLWEYISRAARFFAEKMHNMNFFPKGE